MQQNKQLIDQVTRIISNRQTPSEVITYFHEKSKAVTGYAWSWWAGGDRFTVTARIRPDQREKRGDHVTLYLKSDDLWINGHTRGTAVAKGESHRVTFRATAGSSELSPVIGLSDLLKKASAILQPA